MEGIAVYAVPATLTQTSPEICNIVTTGTRTAAYLVKRRQDEVTGHENPTTVTEKTKAEVSQTQNVTSIKSAFV